MVSNLAKFRTFLGKTCFPLLSCASGTPYKEKKEADSSFTIKKAFELIRFIFNTLKVGAMENQRPIRHMVTSFCRNRISVFVNSLLKASNFIKKSLRMGPSIKDVRTKVGQGGQPNAGSCGQGGRGLVKWGCPHFKKLASSFLKLLKQRIVYVIESRWHVI